MDPETLKTQIRLYLAMEAVNEEKGFDFCGLKGQRELTEHVCLGDVPEMIMNDPYDWRGPKEPIVCATEADTYAAMTMQLMKYISGGLPTIFMDVRLYHPDLDVWDWCNSGNHASYFAARSFDPKENFKKIILSLGLINEQELEVIKSLRNGDLQELSIRFDKNNKINLIQETKQQSIDPEKKLAEILLKGGYQDLTIKAEKGSIRTVKSTIKRKI